MIGDFELSLDESPSHGLLESLRAGLTKHSAELVDRPGFQPLAVVARSALARDAKDTLAGGAYGLLNWTWLDVSLLWVAEPARGHGLGTELMDRLEEEAWRRGCRQAHLETFGFQAGRFYERRGYEIFARLPEYPPGSERIYYRKRLHSPRS